MFPEIVRDEVFRLETRRLWLRWPMMGDAFDAPNAVERPDTAGAGLLLPAVACVAAWRAAIERGEALHLMLEDKLTRTGIGSIHLTLTAERQGMLDYRLAPTHRGEGLMTEAVDAVVQLAFLLEAVRSITALPLLDDACGRAVLERCGFTNVGTGLRTATPAQSQVACDAFRIDRQTWAAWQAPPGPGPGASSWRRAPQPMRMSMSV